MHKQLKRKINSDDRITVALEQVSEHQNREQIAALAYALWQARGCPVGTADEDWLRAEREIGGSSRLDEKVEGRDSAEQSVDAEAADSSVLRFPVGSEVSLTAHAGASRRR
jgi:hypothetical protein